MPRWTHTPHTDPLASVRDFIDNPGLRELVELFGGTWPESSPLRQRIDALADFSVVWDRRNGASRLDIVQTEQDDQVSRTVLGCAQRLGLVEPAPCVGGHYDWVLVLGGLANGCRSRTEFAASLLASSVLTAEHLCLLGSFRALHEGEREEAADFAPGATTEVGMLSALADRTFPADAQWKTTLEGDPDKEPRNAQLSAHRDSRPALSLYAARSSDPERNANSADTYRQFAEDVALDGGRLLLISTHIYAPYQHWDAVRVLGLPRGVELETVGTPPALSRRVFDSAWYLQEIRSALRAGAALAAAVEK